MGEPEAIDYITHWREVVVARRDQHDAACAQEGRTTGDYWSRRAEGFRKFAHQASQGGDPFVDAVLRHLRAEDVVLDVGAGTGRHAIPLARRAARLIALDPAAAMLAFLQEDVASAGLTNVEVIEGTWPDAAARTQIVDIAISAHVLYPIEDIAPFLRAFDAHARRWCYLHVMVEQPWFDQLGLWEAAHGSRRQPQPTYIDVVNILHQLGCYANVAITTAQTPRVFDDLDDAVDRHAESVAVGENAEKRALLRDALADRLEQLPDGRLAYPVPDWRLATVWWPAGALRAG